ncbi:MAG TPA: response regulator transcription factor [Cyclobacteriaceae bacterium]|nr:response regulator transcription factor [Cyclobacteriaceae bacterium]HMV08760.1 response regulator transcription factor [Cyclobacteriaceae bacterium]HMV90218.1 response regulator transcription factor [Cyclobacteriaceae bacterium]HMW99905.1 response regulator transcription factor [Cyclobacteriaceae bacterium]HMX49232.1 response regulator transcription factor [Cyclobacteriaceae bacterium]
MSAVIDEPVILLADDHELCRIAVKRSLREFAITENILEAKDGKEVIAALLETHVDLLILDMKMPRLNGFETVEWAAKHRPKLKILIITMYDEPALIINFMRLGVSGYMHKSEGNLEEAVRDVLNGRFYYSKFLETTITQAQVAVENPAPVTLTAKEKRILPLIAEGRSSEEIAGILNLKKNTVESYRKDLIEKFKVKNSSELINFAHRTGLL